LAPTLPVAIPPILGEGVPGEGYPYPWSVRGWLPGTRSDQAQIDDMPQFAASVAEFILALQCCDTTDGPAAGEHSWYRGASLRHYDAETRDCLAALDGKIDTATAAEVWETALAAEWTREPVWFHGDIAVGNLLVVDGKLAAVIDFGTSGVGDPSCDLVIAWTTFSAESRRAFRDTVGQDSGTWARARGWALWKAMLVLTERGESTTQERVIREVLTDHLSIHCGE
jgi:aminoglycoside phosphotransferase (APT) family kinase protein